MFSRMRFDFSSYEKLYRQYSECDTVEYIPIKTGDEIFFWKDEQSVIQFLNEWTGTRDGVLRGEEYVQPIVSATRTGLEAFKKFTNDGDTPMLFGILFDQPEKHPVYGEYIGYGIHHTSVIRRVSKTHTLMNTKLLTSGGK